MGAENSSKPVESGQSKTESAGVDPLKKDLPQNDLPGRELAGSGLMKAIVQDEFGEAKHVLRLEEIARPEIAADKVLIRVHAAGIDGGVWHFMAGMPLPMRLSGQGLRTPKYRVRGREVAGVIEAVGADVTTLRPGDEVFGIGEGCFAEYATASPAKLVAKPKNVTFTQAAAVSISAITALQAVRDAAQVQAGEKVLVIGASGGVGTFAVQIAKAFGAEVTGVCSTSKVDLVQSIGADHVIDYKRAEITSKGQHYDVILDTGGNRKLRLLRRALTPKGRLVIVGGETGGRLLGGFERGLRAPLYSLFVSQKMTGLMASEKGQDLAVLAELLESGKVVPAIGRTFPLSETPTAVQYLKDGHARGKLVITV